MYTFYILKMRILTWYTSHLRGKKTRIHTYRRLHSYECMDWAFFPMDQTGRLVFPRFCFSLPLRYNDKTNVPQWHIYSSLHRFICLCQNLSTNKSRHSQLHCLRSRKDCRLKPRLRNPRKFPYVSLVVPPVPPLYLCLDMEYKIQKTDESVI